MRTPSTSPMTEALKKVHLNFSDVVDQQSKPRPWRAKITPKVREWFEKKYRPKSGEYWLTTPEKAVKDQRVQIHKKGKDRMSSVTYEIAPIGDYLVVKKNGRVQGYFSGAVTEETSLRARGYLGEGTFGDGAAKMKEMRKGRYVSFKAKDGPSMRVLASLPMFKITTASTAMNMVTGKDVWRGEMVYMQYHPKQELFRVWMGSKGKPKHMTDVVPMHIVVTDK